MLSNRMRRVSGEWRRLALLRRRSREGASAGRAGVEARRPSAAAIREPMPCSPNQRRPGSAVAVSVSDAIKRFDPLELAVDLAELATDPLDVAVDGAVVDVDRLAVGGVHELVAVLHMARPFGERLQQQEFGDREMHLLALPGALMATRIEHQLAAHDALGRTLALGGAGVGAAQHGADALEQQALGERLADEIVGAH